MYPYLLFLREKKSKLMYMLNDKQNVTSFSLRPFQLLGRNIHSDDVSFRGSSSVSELISGTLSGAVGGYPCCIRLTNEL